MGGDHCRAPSPACERMRNVLAALAPLLALCNAQCGAFVSYFECESHGTDAIVAEPLPGTHAECHAFCEGLGLGGCCFVSGESTAPSVCHFQSGNSVAATIDAARLATACATVVNLDCLGSWSACTSACEAAADRQWIETQAPSGSGVVCPESAEACAPGEGECQSVTGDPTGHVPVDATGNRTGEVAVDVTGSLTGNATGALAGNVTVVSTGDVTGNLTGEVTGVAVSLPCVGSWSACTSACEAAVDRQWIETQAPSGSGVACPESAEACAPGEGECPLVLAVIARFGSRKFNTDRKLTVAADVVEPTARSWAWSWYTLDGAKGGFADAPMLTPHEGSAAGVANLVPLPANINAHLPAVILCHYQNQ